MRFTTKHGGRAAGRRAAFALAAGARLRLLRLAATSRLAGGEQAARLRHERQVYRDGLARIAHECEVLSDAQR
jgi:hypothetical protein